ncbi:heme exporter protein A [Alteromonadaceae bacterium Bs31]|nr:heme exporter protein A [Alteromonadaceae bacterium Bs31]
MLFKCIDQQFHAGDIYQIAGPNGAGKTTLLKIVVGLIPALEGKVQWTFKQQPAAVCESLLYFGHQPAVNTSLTATENLRWYFGLNGTKSLDAAQYPSKSAFSAALDKVGLAGYEDVLCFQMSAGQQRRVALARLYLSDAPLWVLDEPFTAIDTRGVAALEQRIGEHANKGGIVLLTSHQALSLPGVKMLDLANFVPSEAA